MIEPMNKMEPTWRANVAGVRRRGEGGGGSGQGDKRGEGTGAAAGGGAGEVNSGCTEGQVKTVGMKFPRTWSGEMIVTRYSGRKVLYRPMPTKCAVVRSLRSPI